MIFLGDLAGKANVKRANCFLKVKSLATFLLQKRTW